MTGVTRVSRGGMGQGTSRAKSHTRRAQARDTKNSKASCQQAAAARRARDAAVRALPIARVAERLEAGEHAAERAALCARAVEARGPWYSKASTSMRRAASVCAHEGL